MYREEFIRQINDPSIKDGFRNAANLYDQFIGALKKADDIFPSLKPNYKRGFLVETFKLEFTTNIRVLAEAFPKITAVDTVFFGIIMDSYLTSEQFEKNFQPLKDFYESPMTLKTLQLLDTILYEKIRQDLSSSTTYVISYAVISKLYIILKEGESGSENTEARILHNTLLETYSKEIKEKHVIDQYLFPIQTKSSPHSGQSTNLDDATTKNKESDAVEAIGSPASDQLFDDLISELNELIGLESIKNDVYSLMTLVRAQHIRAQNGLKTVPFSFHLVFTGNPGTGKTTVARIIAKLYKSIGILKGGQLIEVSRADLVAGYVGQTAIKAQKKIKEAIGGVLFIDEAYSLVKGDNDFGMEALETLLKEMEDHRDELVVIVAGYPEYMDNFINSNPGLRSRFSRYINFPDYSEQELFQIFLQMCKKYDYSLTVGAESEVKKRIHFEKENSTQSFANARMVRNLFEEVITRQSTRIAQATSRDEMSLIKAIDI